VQLQEKYERLALEALLIENGVTFLQSFLNEEFEEVAGIGIIQRKSVGKPQFIHRNFSEYFVAEFLIKELTKKTKQSTQVQEILVNDVLLGTDCLVIRTFLDSLLEESQPSKEGLKGFGEKFNEQ